MLIIKIIYTIMCIPKKIISNNSKWIVWIRLLIIIRHKVKLTIFPWIKLLVLTIIIWIISIIIIKINNSSNNKVEIISNNNKVWMVLIIWWIIKDNTLKINNNSHRDSNSNYNSNLSLYNNKGLILTITNLEIKDIAIINNNNNSKFKEILITDLLCKIKNP